MTSKQTKAKKLSPPKKQVLTPVIFRFAPDDITKLDTLAKKLGHSRSSLSRFVISNFIDKNLER